MPLLLLLLLLKVMKVQTRQTRVACEQAKACSEANSSGICQLLAAAAGSQLPVRACCLFVSCACTSCVARLAAAGLQQK
jgi:hypothetical protein